MKLIVIGLDGASFELIDPWIEEGALPNIAKIKQAGVWADMESVLPPVTSPNWKCYSTGKNPGKLGIFWWENIDWKNRRVYYPVAGKLEDKEIWDYIGEAGMKVGVMGMPTTYPPKKVNGFLIAGGEAENKNFTYPSELEEELKRYGWRNHPQGMIDIYREDVSHEIHEIIDMHFKLADSLISRYNPHFLHLTIFHINTLQHFLWDSQETKKAWEIIDKRIGQFMNQGCDLIIMSDHGSNKINHVFNINTWLKKEGYLSLNTSLRATLYKLGINQQSLAALVSKLRIPGALRKVVPKSLYEGISNISGEIWGEAKTSKINWQRSKATASGQGPIYLNPEGNNGEIKEEIKWKLEALIDPSTGENIIEKVYTKEEIYHGKYLAEAPDLVMDQAKGVHIPGGIEQEDIFGSPRRWQAENKKIGLFMAIGPNIRKGGKVKNISILDLAPTILHVMDVPVPDDMDGRVLKELFRKDCEPGKREVKSRQTEIGERERLRKKIKDLKRQLKTEARKQ